MVVIKKAGNVAQVNIGVNDINSFQLSAIPQSFSFNSVTSIVKSRFFNNWGLEVPLSQLSFDGVVPANEAAFNAALATLSTVTTSGGGGGTPGGAVNSIQYNNAGAFGGYLLSGVGTRMVVADAAGALSTQAIPAGAPILPDTQIAFGNGTDPYTSSAELTHDVAGGIFNVGFSGANLLRLEATGYFFFGDPNSGNLEISTSAQLAVINLGTGAGARFLELNYVNGVSRLGDMDASGNQTYIKLVDSDQTLTYQKGADVWFSTDIANVTGFWGNPGGNLTSVAWDDASKLISLSIPSIATFTIDQNNPGVVAKLNTDGVFQVYNAANQPIFTVESFSGANLIYLCDVVLPNQTQVTISDDSQFFIYEKNGAIFFSTIVATGTEAGFWGNPGGNLTGISWDDAAGEIVLTTNTNWLFKMSVNDGTIFLTGAGSKYIDIVVGDEQMFLGKAASASFITTSATDGVTLIGDPGNGNSTKGVFDDGAQTVTLTAANGVGIGGTPNSVSMLDVQSTTKGVKFPSMTTAQRTAITTTNIAGLVVWDTDINGLFVTLNNGDWLQL